MYEFVLKFTTRLQYTLITLTFYDHGRGRLTAQDSKLRRSK